MTETPKNALPRAAEPQDVRRPVKKMDKVVNTPSAPVPRWRTGGQRRALFLVLAIVCVGVPFVLKGAALHFPNAELTRNLIAPFMARIRPWDNLLVIGGAFASAVFWIAYFLAPRRATRA